jgi:hypothetical protein
LIVTVKLHEAELFPSSVAVQMTVVVPSVKGSPELWSQETVAEPAGLARVPLLSVAVTVKLTFAEPEPGELSNLVMFAGQWITGFSTSVTVTAKVQVSPDSVEAVTVEMPIGKKCPEIAVVLTLPQVPDVTGGLKVTCAPFWPGSLGTAAGEVGQTNEQVGVPPTPEISNCAEEELLLLSGSGVVEETLALVTNVPAEPPTVYTAVNSA